MVSGGEAASVRVQNDSLHFAYVPRRSVVPIDLPQQHLVPVSMRPRALVGPGLVVVLLALGAGGIPPAQAQQQEIPDAVREELEARNLTPEQARRRACSGVRLRASNSSRTASGISCCWA